MEKKIYVRDVLEFDDVKESLMCEREYSRELGREEGREEGRAEGREEGRVEEKRLLASNMLAKGLEPAFVAEISGLTEDEVVALSQQ